ncbi:MAG: response regulator [Candidatus Pacebacteria bacterium]|nr:response regulator [Candidatus Paceibacterota bacterium]
MDQQLHNSASTQKFIAGVYQHFKDEASEVLARMSLGMEAVLSGAVQNLPLLNTIKSESQKLLAEVSNTGVTEIETMIRQFNSFIQKLNKITAQDARVLNEWMERLRRSIHDHGIKIEQNSHPNPQGGRNPYPPLIKSGPVFEVKDIVKEDVVIVLVMPDRTSTMIVERELAACGYRVAHTADPKSAIELCAKIDPDLVLCNVTLDGVSGVDLAQNFKSNPRLNHLNFALLTSYDLSNPIFSSKPGSVPVIRKGGNFGEDLTRSLHRFGII